MCQLALPCSHWWIVEPTDARVGNDTLDAECKWCGATRTYPKMIVRDWGGRLQEVEIG
jgi:hypothetical protein